MSSFLLPQVQQRIARVQLLCTDVDGVLTDGGLYYTDRGDELKQFNVKDGLGMQLAMRSGVHVAILSASAAPATAFRAKKLGIPHVMLGVERKIDALQQLCDELGVPLERVAYVGDDLNDLDCLKAVGCPMTVADAVPAIQAVALYTTTRAGGKGAMREICELIIQAQQHRNEP